MNISGINHFAIKVRDLDAAERFYCGVLGLIVRRRWYQSDGADGPDVAGNGGEDAGSGSATAKQRSIWLSLGDGLSTFLALELATGADGPATSKMDRAERSESGGHHLLAFQITPAQRPLFEDRLAAAGVVVFHRTAFTIYFADPEGNRLGLSHHPHPHPLWAPDGSTAGSPSRT